MTSQEWFREACIARWQEIRGAIDDNLVYLQEICGSAPLAFARNFEKWDIFGQRINQEPEHIMALGTWDAHADALHDWLIRRAAWLDDCFANEAAFSDALEGGRHK